jgi:hypothetical protein
VDNILIGRAIGEDVFRLNADIRTATLNEYNKRSVVRAHWYTPWLSMFPRLPEVELPEQLLLQPTVTRGGLVVDRTYLNAARDFMLPRTIITRNGIFDQKHSDWVAETQVSERQFSLYSEGRAVLLACNPTLARLFSELVDFTIPLPGQRNRGFANHLIRGAIFRTVPEDENKYDVAIDLAHETGHYGLMVLQSIDPIIKSNPDKLVHSTVRNHIRPAIQVFHAAVAMAFMQMVVASMPNDPVCQETGARRGMKYAGTFSNGIAISLELLLRECEFTEIGQQLVNELSSMVQR